MNNPAAISETQHAGSRDENPGVAALTVLQVLPALETGGVERGTIDVAAAVVAAGGRAIVVSTGGRMEAELQRAGATHIRMPVDRKGPRHIWRNAGRLARLIRDENVDIIHARSRAPAWSARIAARRTGTPFVTTFHGVYNYKGALKKAYNRVMTTGDKVIAISAYVADHMVEHYNVDRSRIEIIHRGVDVAQFDSEAVTAARVIQLSEAWRLPDGAPVIMLAGRLARWKGHAVLIDALTHMQRRDFVAVIVGSEKGRESYVEELLKRVETNDLEQVVRFVGHCSDMPAAFKLADVVAHTSTDPEAFGRVIAEAAAMGRPVVASDQGGPRETVIPGKTGWLVPPGDAAALARALETALDMADAERRQLAAAAAENIRLHFSKPVMTRKTLNVYASLMRDRGRSDG